MNAEPRAVARDLKKIFGGSVCYEIFGRKNNLMPGWTTFGDQLHEDRFELNAVYIKRDKIGDKIKVRGVTL